MTLAERGSGFLFSPESAVLATYGSFNLGFVGTDDRNLARPTAVIHMPLSDLPEGRYTLFIDSDKISGVRLHEVGSKENLAKLLSSYDIDHIKGRVFIQPYKETPRSQSHQTQGANYARPS